MSVGIYMDVNVHAHITRGLRRRGISVLTAQEDGARELPDERLLARAGELGYLLVTSDEDFLSEATSCQQRGESFATVIYGHQLRLKVGRCIDDLALIAEISTPADLRGQILYLPLK